MRAPDECIACAKVEFYREPGGIGDRDCWLTTSRLESIAFGALENKRIFEWEALQEVEDENWFMFKASLDKRFDRSL